MLVISRFRYADGADSADGVDSAGRADSVSGPAGRARADLGRCLEQFAARPGFVTGSVGRAVDDPAIWVLETRWENVGAYRRALSSYEVKMTAVPLLAQAINEPSAYEVIIGAGATTPNEVRARGEERRPGR